MTPHTYVSESAYKDGYTDAYLELEGAPPLSIWDERVEHLTEQVAMMDGSAVMNLYHPAYYDGWRDGYNDAFTERTEG